MRLFTGILLALLTAGPAFGAVKLQFWHSMSGEKARLVGDIVKAFNKAKKGKIQVEAQFVGTYVEGLNKLRTSLMAKKGPHVAQIYDIGTQVMIDSGATVPLQQFIDKDPSFPAGEILKPIRRYYEISGRLHSLPFATSNPIIYYNADAFKKAGVKVPGTFKELVDVACKLTDKKAGKTGITWPLHSWFFEQFLARQGKELANNTNGRKARATEVNYLSPEALAFVNLWKTLEKKGCFANVGRGWQPAEQNFLAGRSAMLIHSTSDVFVVSKKASFNLMTAPLPAAKKGVTGGTIIGGNSLWILKDKPEAERKAAYEFLKFTASKKVQRMWHTKTGYFPIRKDLIRDLEKEGFYNKFPAARTAIEQMRSAPDIPATHGALLGVFSEAREHIESAIEKILSGTKPESALKTAKRQTERALRRYNRARKRAGS